jgi:hypothetical protein
MTIYVYENTINDFKHKPFTRAFARWSGASLRKIRDFSRINRLPDDASAVAFFGIKGENYGLYKHCVENKIPFYYMDHAYVNTSPKPYKPPFWFRIVKNGFLQNNIVSNDPKRYKENFNFNIEPYANYKNQNLILVVPPSNIVASLLDFDPGKWLEDTINEIKSRCPEKEILVRYKYKDNIKPFRYDEPIDSFFPKTYCVVTHSSNLAFKTMMKGIPVISSYVSASRPVSNSFETINNPIEHDREHLLYSLLHGQFKLEEIQKKLVSFKEFSNMEQVIK